MTVKKILLIVGLAIFLIVMIMPFVIIATYWNDGIAKYTGSGGAGVGGLCTNVPEPYAHIFREAGSKFSVQPAFIAAIFVGEHQSVKETDYKKWPNANGPWDTSNKQAMGPFQFVPDTWATHQQDGDGDGKKDVQNLADATYGASHLLSQNGAGNNTIDENHLSDSASRYNSGASWTKRDPNGRWGQDFAETRKYVAELVLPAFKAFYCPTTTVASISGVFDPAPGGNDGVPLFRQGDPRYATNQTGGKNFSIWGCCPTAAAMVMRYYGAPVDPIIVGKLTVEKGFYDGSGGTQHGLLWLKALGDAYGLPQRQAIDVTGGRNWDKVLALLGQKKPLIARGDGAKPYSENGHCIVLTGYDSKTGLVRVNNPSAGLGDGPFPLEHMKQYTTVVYYLGK